ncbi:hypothetical protein Avbf_02191 [Armadillidium vulgare]|nr:hypothetical protein Avbf_02191 [Armadillidium vulgare]
MDSSKSRRMKYPYTFSSKLALFPWAFHFKHNWLFRWWFVGMGLSLPIFAYISSKACKAGVSSYSSIKKSVKKNSCMLLAFLICGTIIDLLYKRHQIEINLVDISL